MPAYNRILLPWDSQPQEAVEVDPALGFTDVFTGASIGLNHASGRRETLTAGGSGFSQRATAWGQSIYTPNGGWLDLALDRDWKGPNTISCLVVIRGMDANYGGLFSKNSSGTDTQFAVGRDSTSNQLYASVDSAIARPVAATSISSLIGVPAVLTFTHNGQNATYGYIYLNGVLVGQTALVLGTQPAGTGPLGLGRGRDNNASFDSEVDWLAFLRTPRVMSDAEIQAHFNSPRSVWSLFTPRSILVPVSAGSSANTTITGTLGTAAASGYTATIGANRFVAGTLGTATASGFTATVNVNRSITNVVGVANAIGYQATVSTTNNTNINGTLGTASASGYKATIGANRLITGSFGTATATGYKATVANTNDTTVNSNLGIAAATGFTATVNANRTITSVVGVATAVGFTATVVAGGSPIYSENSGLWLDIGSKLSLPLDPPRMPNWNMAGRPSAPQDYEYGFNTTTGTIEVWTGSAWV